jgi:Protein of unknown function (DUF1499)
MKSLSRTSLFNGFLIVLVALLTSPVDSYGIASDVKDTSRRNVLQVTKNVALVVASGATTIIASSASASEIAACPPRSQNCIRTTWTASSGTKDVTGKVLELFRSYPVEGQSDIDKGGWTIVKDGSDDGTIRLEFKSGIGNFAKFFNGGKPFVDDVTVVVTGNAIDIRSASRIGDSDLGVNQKRLQFLVTKAREMGWDAPDPKY